VVDVAANKIDLLARLCRGDVFETVADKAVGQLLAVVGQCEPVDVHMVAGDAAKEEVHRPTTTKPDRHPKPIRQCHELGDASQLLLCKSGTHALRLAAPESSEATDDRP